MEGVLWVRVRRGKLLRGWQKRYYVLSDDGALKEFAETAAPSAATASVAGKRRHSTAEERALTEKSGMVLTQELLVLGSTTVKTLPFPMVGRHHVFQVTKKSEFRLALSAKSADVMHEWIRALRAVIGSTSSQRQRSPALGGRTLPSAPWTRSPSLELGGSSSSAQGESEFLDVPALAPSDRARFAETYEWRHERVRTTQDVVLSGVTVPRGAVLVAVNGISLQTLSTEQVAQLVSKPSSAMALGLGLRFLRAPYKRGVLRCKLCVGLSTQLKTLAQYRSGVREWQQHVVEVDGDVLTCVPRSDAKSSTTRRVLPLTGDCTVKRVHEVVAEQPFCFVVSVHAHAMLFQARSDAEAQQWMDAIERAIHFADGVLAGPDRASFDSLQLESSLNMRSLQSGLAFADGDDGDGGGAESDVDDSVSSQELAHPHLRRVGAESPLNLTEHEQDDDAVAETSLGPVTVAGGAVPLPATDLADMMLFLQRSGRLVEAFQLMGRNPSHRCAYWKTIFLWALEPVDASAFAALLERPLVDADNVQVQKDIPRTAKWLAGSAGAPHLSVDARRVRLECLEHVLHAFLSGCTSHVRTDGDDDASTEARVADTAATSSVQALSQSFYMQGMNGLAFILLDVLADDELAAFQFFRGVVARVLPHVFGIRSEGAERDNFDLFSSLAEVGATLEDVVALHLPHFHGAMDGVGIPVCLLAYKWFPTLFSDISLMAHNAQLRYDTLLVTWDICLLMGLEGVFCVALALCSSAEESVVSAGRDASAEQMSNALVRVISQLSPEDLITSVCEVLELCNHHVLLKLRNGHRRRLQLGYAKQHYDASRSAPPMTVKDLDSGKVFKISRSGGMLLPVMKAVGS